MAEGPPPDLSQPYGPAGSGVPDLPSSGGSTGNVIDDVTGAVGDAVGGAVASSALSGLTGLFESIASGMAHTVNVILNNMFYGSVMLFGAILMVAGFIMIINATPAGAAVKSGAGKGLSLATKVLPI